MTKPLLVALLLAGAVLSVSAGEQLDLTTPETAPNVTNYRVDALVLDWAGARIDVRVSGTNGEKKSFTYTGTTATTLMIALNKANLTTKSLQRRILERLVTDGLYAGTVSGSPD